MNTAMVEIELVTCTSLIRPGSVPDFWNGLTCKLKNRIMSSWQLVEPGPGEIGWKDRYRYASHALRFDVNSPGEPRDLFVRRINAAARAEDEGHPGTSSASDHWIIGQARDRGSIDSDIWQGKRHNLRIHIISRFHLV